MDANLCLLEPGDLHVGQRQLAAVVERIACVVWSKTIAAKLVALTPARLVDRIRWVGSSDCASGEKILSTVAPTALLPARGLRMRLAGGKRFDAAAALKLFRFAMGAFLLSRRSVAGSLTYRTRERRC